MSTTSLGRVALETMANYRAAAQQIVNASGAGSRRVVKAVDGSWLGTLPAPFAARLDGWRHNVSSFALKGIDQIVERSEQVIGLGSDFAIAQVSRWSDRAADVDNRYLADGLRVAVRLTLPAAQIALAVSGRVAEGAASIAQAAGVKAQPAKARRAVKVRRAAKTAAPKANARRAAKVPAKAAAPARRRKAVAAA